MARWRRRPKHCKRVHSFSWSARMLFAALSVVTHTRRSSCSPHDTRASLRPLAIISPVWWYILSYRTALLPNLKLVSCLGARIHNKDTKMSQFPVYAAVYIAFFYRALKVLYTTCHLHYIHIHTSTFSTSKCFPSRVHTLMKLTFTILSKDTFCNQITKLPVDDDAWVFMCFRVFECV